MSKKIFLSVVLMSALLASSASAQHLHISFDYSAFRYDSTKTFVELYYSFNRKSVTFVKSDSMFSGMLLFNVIVEPATLDTVSFSQQWKVPIQVTDTATAALSNNLVGQDEMALAPGKYRLLVHVVDENDTSEIDNLQGVLDIPRYGTGKLEVSDVELCTEITATEGATHGIFYKNTYNVVPNPTGIYGIGMPIVYYYAEVYNIPQSPVDSTFSVGYEVIDSYGQVHKSFTRTRNKFGTSSVEVGTVNASDLKTGTYTFVFTVRDSAANMVAMTKKRFFVYNPNLGAPVGPSTNMAGAPVLSSEFATMGEKQLDEEFKETRYISTAAEREQFSELKTLEAKRQFLYEFWKKRNNSPVSNTNDYRTEYMQRVEYANEHFRSGNMAGWRTDRGRVYIIYGKPDQIDRHPNEMDSKPYEIWYYNSIQGGVSFDFVDRTGFGDYTLVNSTARDEIHDSNWQQYLGSGGN